MSHDFPMIFPWFTGNWSPLAMLPRWSSTTVTSARILLASCLSWMAWLWTNFHMHNFCVCFGRLAPAKKHLRRSFFGAKKTKKLHQCTRITSEIPWFNVFFSSACLEVYATLSTCAACSWPRNQMSGNLSWIVVHIVPINVPGFRHLPPQKSSQAVPGRRWAMAQSSERWPGIRKSHDISHPYRSKYLLRKCLGYDD